MLDLGQKSDRTLVERFSQWIPGWNHRQLTLGDLEKFCDECGVIMVEESLEDAEGYAFWIDSTPFIYINAFLSYPEKVITGFHELAHILYHPPSEDAIFLRRHANWNWSKCDRQAEIVGCIAWMPDSEARGRSVEELMARYEVMREVAEFRSQLRLWYTSKSNCKRIKQG